MPSQTKENYLKAIYSLSMEGKKVSLSSLSERLNVSNPSANSMVKKLKELGWIDYQKYKPIELTELGTFEASRVVRRHRLTEMFLVSKMSFAWDEVHEIAEEVEHIKSERFFDRMDEMLGFPSHDPHGSPIPNKKGIIQQDDFRKLSSLKETSKGRFSALAESSVDFLRYLTNKDLELGTIIQVHEIEPFDKSMLVSYKDFGKVSLSREICERILVSPISE